MDMKAQVVSREHKFDIWDFIRNNNHLLTLITLIILLLRGRGRWAQVVVESMQDAAKVTCMIFVVFIGATFFNLFLIQAGVPTYVSELIVSAPYSPKVLIYLIL